MKELIGIALGSILIIYGFICYGFGWSRGFKEGSSGWLELGEKCKDAVRRAESRLK